MGMVSRPAIPILLRFRDSGQEAAFKLVHQEMLPRIMQTTSVLSCIALLVIFLPTFRMERARDVRPLQLSADDARTGWCLVCFSAFLVSICAFSYATLKVKGKVPRAVDNIELFSLLCICFVANCCMYMNRWQVARMYGQDPVDVWQEDPRGSEGSTLLGLDIFVTAVSLFIPIRVSLVWVVHASVLLLFVANSACFGSPFPGQSKVNICFMVMLEGLAYFGAWRNERAARMQWQSLQQELDNVRVQKHEISQQQLELDESSALARGMHSVLTGLCDVVFKLASDCRVLGANSARDSTFGCRMEGRVLLEFLADTSPKRFLDMLGRSRETGLLQMMSFGCVRQGPDGQEAFFDAEFLVVEVAGVQSAQRYLLGMRMQSQEEAFFDQDDDLPYEAKDILACLPNHVVKPETEVSFDLTDSDSASQVGGPHQHERAAARARAGSGGDDGKSTLSLAYSQSAVSQSLLSQSALSQSSGPSIQLVRITKADAQVQASAARSEASSMTDVGTDLSGFRCSRCDKPPALPGTKQPAQGGPPPGRKRHRRMPRRSNSCPPSGRQVAVPGMRPTPESTCTFLIEHAMRASNLVLPATPCCQWHNYVRDFESKFRQLRSERCQLDWEPWSAMQCPECYGMQPDTEGDTCTVCAASLPPAAVPSQYCRPRTFDDRVQCLS